MKLQIYLLFQHSSIFANIVVILQQYERMEQEQGNRIIFLYYFLCVHKYIYNFRNRKAQAVSRLIHLELITNYTEIFISQELSGAWTNTMSVCMWIMEIGNSRVLVR